MNTEILDIQSVIVEYLQSVLPQYKAMIKKGPMSQDLPQKFILVYDNGGLYSIFDQKSEPELQILTQSINNSESHTFSLEVLKKMKELYDYSFPGSDIKILKLKSSTLPQPLGNVGNGLFQHSFNLEIIYQLGETQE